MKSAYDRPITVSSICYHRNGVGGAPFWVIRFTEREGTEARDMLGIVFDEPAHVAVFDFHLLAAGVTAFGLNSWRGDCYESALRQAVADFEETSEKS